MAEPNPADDRARFWLAFIALIGFFAILFLWTFHPPALPGDLAGAAVGYAAGFVSAGMLFFFGASSKS